MYARTQDIRGTTVYCEIYQHYIRTNINYEHYFVRTYLGVVEREVRGGDDVVKTGYELQLLTEKHSVNPLTPVVSLTYFTLSNARRFYSPTKKAPRR